MANDPSRKNRPALLLALIAVLALLWLSLSGYFTPLMLSFMGFSLLTVALLSCRMGIVDREGFPIHIAGRLAGYLPWLLNEIFRSNIDVARLILFSRGEIEPRLLRVLPSQQSDLGRAIHANSITLTPGTVSMGVEGETIIVHALTRASAQAVIDGEMDRRVTRLERGES
jgi:multicomponent Na+:H+ antiporter subunit E